MQENKQNIIKIQNESIGYSANAKTKKEWEIRRQKRIVKLLTDEKEIGYRLRLIRDLKEDVFNYTNMRWEHIFRCTDFKNYKVPI